MALDKSRQLKRSLNDDSSTSSSDTDEETVATFNSCDFGGL
jgi:hypothetical protein